MGRLNVNIGAKIADINSVKADIQAQLEKIGKKLGLQIDTAKISNITGIRDNIQQQINQVAGKLTVKIDSIKVSASALKSLKEQLSNTALDIKANVKTDGNTDNLNKNIQQTSQQAKKLNESIGAINTKALDQINARLEEINTQYGELAKKKVNFNGAGEMTSTLLTYKNALGQVITETYGWSKATKETESVFGLLKTHIDTNNESMENFKTKIIQALTESERLIQSFKNSGNFNDTFISNLNLQLQQLASSDMSLKATKTAVDNFVSSLKRLKTSESQILTLKKSLDKLSEIKSKLTDGKKIELMTNGQAQAVQQVEAQMQKMQSAMTQLQGGATKTSAEIRTLTSASSDAGNKLKIAFDEGTVAVNKLGTTLKTVASYVIGGGLMVQGIQAIKKAFSELTEIDKSLIDISRVASESLDLSAYTSHANQLGMALNQTTNDMLQTAYAVQKLGYDLEGGGDELLRWTSIMSNVGDLSIDEAMKDLVTVLKGFNVTASESERIINAMNEVGKVIIAHYKPILINDESPEMDNVQEVIFLY